MGDDPLELDRDAMRRMGYAVVDLLVERIATLGDQPNDVLMFEKAGLSIAMGNAPDEVKRKADWVTASCAEEGFATAIERLVLANAALAVGDVPARTGREVRP